MEVLMILSNGTIGNTYVVKDIQLESGIMRRLQMLGLTQGTSVELLNKKRNGAVIFKVRGTRFAIGKNVSEGIMIGGSKDES
jgi:ferrous iron transport protein A